MEATMTTEQPPAAAHILTRSVALVLRCEWIGNHRRIELTAVDMEKNGAKLDKEKDEVAANFRLFSNTDLRPARSILGACKSRLAAMSVDGGTRLFGSGTYLLPLLGVSEAVKVLEEHKALAKVEADTLADKLAEIKERRADALGALYDDKAYPTEDEVRAAFSIGWRFVSFSAPDQLLEVDQAAYEAAVQENNALLAAAYEDVVAGLRASALAVLRDLAKRLRPRDDGKEPVLRPQALNDLNELLQRLPVLNSVGEDAELARILAKVGVLADGMDVEMLRKAPAIRGMLLDGVAEAVAQLDEVITTGRRAMNL